MAELNKVLKSSKLNKAPGEDGITNEFFRECPSNWKFYLLTLFNKTLREECVPDAWASIILSILHKQGDRKDPSNHRGIALVNHISKLFTALLAERLYNWAENSKLLPEGQAGFRSSRGCMDNLFVLHEVIHSKLRQKKGSSFIIFVDLKRALDTVNHKLLWTKLLGLGVSAKIIRILKNLYDKASIKIKTQSGFSESIKITEGVLQGEILSPLLFILFISDMEDFFRAEGMYGANITTYLDILLLLYADDLAIIANNKSDVARKLKILFKYCEFNKLQVNVSKTKILYCRKAGKIPKNMKFYYSQEQIEIVSSYTYLGIPISSSGLGRLAVQCAINKSRIANGAVIATIHR